MPYQENHADLMQNEDSPDGTRKALLKLLRLVAKDIVRRLARRNSSTEKHKLSGKT